MRRCALILALLLVCPVPAPAQTSGPCASPEARQFDFWLGQWDAVWEGGTGANDIRRRFGDCVIEENFSGNMPNGEFLGHSVSVYDARSGQWRQTWVDNQGGYLLFTGGLGDDGIMRLYGEPVELADGRSRLMRMSWVDVTDDAFDWNWERSFDAGETWEMAWQIHYTRR